MRTREGVAFTLIELVVVIAIVGVLAAIAIPRFITLRVEAYNSQRDGTVSAVRSGVLLVASKNQTDPTPQTTTFPPNLEQTWGSMTGAASNQLDGTVCSTNGCFQLVVPGGFKSPDWTETSTTGVSPTVTQVYTFANPATSPVVSTKYTYTQADGTFR